MKLQAAAAVLTVAVVVVVITGVERCGHQSHPHAPRRSENKALLFDLNAVRTLSMTIYDIYI